MRLMDGAPAVGPPFPNICERETHAREVRTDMELKGKKVIALGERDSVPGEAIAEVATQRRRRGDRGAHGVLRLNGFGRHGP